MSTSASSKLQPPVKYKTRASDYERYASFFIASIIIIGLMVTILFLMWLTSLDWSTSKVPAFTENLRGNNSNPEGIAEDFEEPGVEELADVAEPQLADAVEALTSDPSRQKAAVEAVNGNKELVGTGKGLGDARLSGPGDGGTLDYVPDSERWDIRYSTSSQNEYFRQLDHFGIELGSIDPESDYIGYAVNLTKKKADSRAGNREIERKAKRIYFRYRSGYKLQLWDIEKLNGAGISTKGRHVVQFYPNKTRQMLLNLEKAKLGGISLETVRKTTFGVRATSNGFEYYVLGDIQFR